MLSVLGRSGSSGRALVLAAAVIALLLGVLSVDAQPADAQSDLSIVCTRSGDTLSWTATNRPIQVRGYRFASGDASSWLGTVSGSDNSYQITDADKFKAAGDRYFIRFHLGGAHDRECTNAGPPASPVSCTQNGGVLTWIQPDVSVDGDEFFVRRVNPNGSSTYVDQVPERNSATNTWGGGSPDESYIVRYRISSSPADRDVFDVPCTGGATPPDPGSFSCVQDGGLQWTAVPEAIDGGNGQYHVRRVNDDGSSRWVQSTSQTSLSPSSGTFDEGDFLIRYRVRGNDGQIFVIDQPCDRTTSPPPEGAITCRAERFGFQTEYGYDVIIEGAQPGDSFSLIVDLEGLENSSTPLEVDDFLGIRPNTYFRQFGRTGPVDVAVREGLGELISCGTISVTAPPDF